jgi:hypothetical protein
LENSKEDNLGLVIVPTETFRSYCNLDFLILSAVIGFAMAWLIVSYDIACQYSARFWQRMLTLPKCLHLALPLQNVFWKVPNFHPPAHKLPCHSPYSFHYMFGVGKNHGEGVEQNWSFSNGVAASTKLMGPGSRAATLEDIFGFHNYDCQLVMREWILFLSFPFRWLQG